MATGLAVGGDVEQALGRVGVPNYVLDTTGVVRWINAAAERLVGDVRGRQFTSVVAPEDSRRARELFARKVLGKSPTEATGVFVSTGGTRVAERVALDLPPVLKQLDCVGEQAHAGAGSTGLEPATSCVEGVWCVSCRR